MGVEIVTKLALHMPLDLASHMVNKSARMLTTKVLMMQRIQLNRIEMYITAWIRIAMYITAWIRITILLIALIKIKLIT